MSPWISDLYLRSQTDARLLSLTRDGHGRAFAVLAERYRAELLGQARRLSSSANAEDLLQQTLLSAFAALNRGAEVGHVRGWLHAILRNAATRARGPVEAPLELAMQTGEAPDALLEARADARLMLSALGELPARQRKALVGSTVQGLSRAELAMTLGVSEGAVRQLVHRARSTVRAVITAVTPYPVLRWLTGAAGSASAGPPELALATGAAGAGGVVAKLGIVAAAGAIAASGLAAAGHQGVRSAHHAGHHVHVTHRAGATIAAVVGTGGGPVTAARSREFIAAAPHVTSRPVLGSQRRRGSALAGQVTGHGSGRGAPRSVSGGQSGAGGATGTGSITSGRRAGSGGADGRSQPSGGADGSHGSGGADGSHGSSGDAGSGSGAASGASTGNQPAGSTTTTAPTVTAPPAQAASDGGDSNVGGGSAAQASGSSAGADGPQTTETSTSSTGSRDLLPPAGSSPATDH